MRRPSPVERHCFLYSKKPRRRMISATWGGSVREAGSWSWLLRVSKSTVGELDSFLLCGEFRSSSSSMPEMQNVYHRSLLVAFVIDQKRRYRHFADSAPPIVERKTFR